MVKKSTGTESDNGEKDSEDTSKETERIKWSAVFDLIQSEYGWTDERILNCTMDRLGQIMKSIDNRKINKIKMMNQAIKTICSYIVMTSWLDKKNKESILNELIDNTSEKGKESIKYNDTGKLMNVFGGG